MTEQHNGRQLLIGEVAAHAGVNAKTVRYYESIGLLPQPNRTPNGYRSYSAADVSRLIFVRRAQSLGLSLGTIQDILVLQDAGNRPCAEVQQVASNRVLEIDRQIADLQRLREELVELADRAALFGNINSSACEYCPAISHS